MLDRFLRIMRAVEKGVPVDYGIPPIGTIRFFTLPPDTRGAWYIQTIVSHDRTLREWLSLINTWKAEALPEKYNTSLHIALPNPFTSRGPAAAFLTDLLDRELRLRMLARKFVSRIRERIYARRVVGADCDLSTTLPIPEYAMVRVRDRESRSMYCFHANTAKGMICSALNYCQFGIAAPQAPKNPYTNRVWTVAQLMVLTSQIMAYDLHSMRRRISVDLLKFRASGHVIAQYFHKYGHEIMVRGALSFFKDVYNPDWAEICGDILADLYDTIGHDICDGWRVVKMCVLGRLLSKELTTRWDTLLCSVWVHTNFNKCYKFKTYDDMLSEFETLHGESYAWWCAQPKRILQRSDTSNAAVANVE